MDDILWGHHSNKNSLTKLLRGVIYFPRIYKKEFWIFVSLCTLPIIKIEGAWIYVKRSRSEKYHTQLSIT